MPFAVDPYHRKFFRTQGWIEFEDVLEEKDQQALLAPTPSSLKRIFRRYEFGNILFALTDERLFRLALFNLAEGAPRAPLFLEISGEQWGVVFCLTGENKGNVSFCSIEGFESLAFEPTSCYLFVSVTASYLNHERHPILYRS